MIKNELNSPSTDRPMSNYFKILNKERKAQHAQSVRAISVSGAGGKQLISGSFAPSVKDQPSNSVKLSGGQESFRIKLIPGEESRPGTGTNLNSLKKKGGQSKASIQDEVTQNLMERIRTKIKAMNTLIAEGKLQNFTDLESASVTSDRMLNFKHSKHAIISRQLLARSRN